MGWEPVRLTNRQFVTWTEWLDQQWNQPDKVCEYLIQIATEIRRGYAKNPKDVEELRLKFNRVKPDGTPVEEEQEDTETSMEWKVTLSMINLASRIPPEIKVKVTDPDGTQYYAYPRDLIRKRMREIHGIASPDEMEWGKGASHEDSSEASIGGMNWQAPSPTEEVEDEREELGLPID